MRTVITHLCTAACGASVAASVMVAIYGRRRAITREQQEQAAELVDGQARDRYERGLR